MRWCTGCVASGRVHVLYELYLMLNLRRKTNWFEDLTKKLSLPAGYIVYLKGEGRL